MPPAPPINRLVYPVRAPAGNDQKRIAQGVGCRDAGNDDATSHDRDEVITNFSQLGILRIKAQAKVLRELAGHRGL